MFPRREEDIRVRQDPESIRNGNSSLLIIIFTKGLLVRGEACSELFSEEVSVFTVTCIVTSVEATPTCPTGLKETRGSEGGVPELGLVGIGPVETRHTEKEAEMVRIGHTPA